MVAMKLGNTPRPMAWSPPLASFPPLLLILVTNSSATNSSNLYPSSCGGGFWWMGVDWLIGCGGHRRQELEIDQWDPRSKGSVNEARKWGGSAGIGRLAWAQFRPVWVCLPPHVISCNFDFSLHMWLFWHHHPHDQDRRSCCMNSDLFALVLGNVLS
jgi:hypothetical protein